MDESLRWENWGQVHIHGARSLSPVPRSVPTTLAAGTYTFPGMRLGGSLLDHLPAHWEKLPGGDGSQVVLQQPLPHSLGHLQSLRPSALQSLTRICEPMVTELLTSEESHYYRRRDQNTQSGRRN